jgi:hypothetical protein
VVTSKNSTVCDLLQGPIRQLCRNKKSIADVVFPLVHIKAVKLAKFAGQ